MFKRILVPLDRSSFAEQALGLAAVIARAAGAQIDLVLVHEPSSLAGHPDISLHVDQIDDERQYLSAVGEELMRSGSIPTTHAVVVGEVVHAICKRATSLGADLIVMTSHGRTGLKRSWIGSVANEVLRTAGVPVLLWRARDNAGNPIPPFMPVRQILVPLDGSAFAEEVIETVAEIARCTGARICMLGVVQPVQLRAVETVRAFGFPLFAEDEIATARATDSIMRDLSEAARILSERTGLAVDSHVIVRPDVAEAIVDFALEGRYDAIGMSTHGRGASRLIFGSVADKVMHAAGLPMILRRPTSSVREFVSSRSLRRRRHRQASAEQIGGTLTEIQTKTDSTRSRKRPS